MSVVNVQVVRPVKTGVQLATHYIALVLGYFLAGLVVTVAARVVGFVPDLGYLESVALVIGVRALFNKPGDYIWWTKE
jgi:uncharacterized membrane protein